MELFTYLMAKNDHNTSVKKDLFSYLLGKNQSGTYQEFTGTSISANNTKKGKMKVNLLGNTSQTGTPTPSSPIPVNVVSGDNTIVSTGKNLLGEEEHGGINESTGQNISNANRWRTINYIKVTPNTSYTLSSNASSNIWYIFYYYDKSKNFISSKPLPATASVNWTTPSNCEYMRCVVGDTATIQTTERQLELGNTATPYEPYQSSTYPINLGTYELCKISTYQDRFFKNIPNTTDYNSDLEDNEWYLEKKIGKVVLDGSEDNWQTSSLVVSGYKSYYVTGLITTDNATDGYSNYFQRKLFEDWTGLLADNFFEFANNSIGFRIDETIANDLSAFKTWLGNHNTIIYYTAKTPTYTPITGTLKDELEAVWGANSYKGTTNINQINNDLPFNLDVEIKVGS